MPDAPDNRPQVHRRGPDGRMEVGPDWESLIERQIREATAQGQFDNLPYQGEPLPNDDNPLAGDMALGFHVLKNAGVAPPWIEAAKEAERLLELRDAILAHAASGDAPSGIARKRDRAALEGIVTQANLAIARVNAEAPADSLFRRPASLADALARYNEACRR